MFDDESNETLLAAVVASVVTLACVACSALPPPAVDSARASAPVTNESRAARVASTRDPNATSSTLATSGTAPPDTREPVATAPERDGPAPPTASSSPGIAPPVVKAPFAATGDRADGQWRPFGTEPDGGPLFWRTLLHPNERSKFVSVDVVAVDLRRFRLEWVVGAGDVGAATLDAQTPGVFAASWARYVVAMFNGGFQARHGYWGQQSHGVTLVKPKAEGCGIALYEDGRVVLGNYEATNQPGLVTYRQAPPCLIANAELNPRLLAGRDAIWAGNGTKEKTRRRSAVGLTRDRQTLFFMVGVEAEPIDLARALTALGADYGLQLDINWNWTRFFLVEGAANDSPTLSEPLLSGMVADKGEYVRRPSRRDFFAIVKRPAEH